MTAADMFARHGIPSKVQAAAERETTAQIRDRDEREGRARRQLTDAAARVDAQTVIAHRRASAGDDAFTVDVVQYRPKAARREITESGPDLVECLDRARDRLNRQEWDR
ncbi:hypothetical protein [Gordonia sp. OPL2]|uniref:hypothetical protein n=1 Tax=Gordonia sp. OPL2 TaxID=2486274 RepID=UPI0016563B01|nr:hypothetical protein [Gordonia sp. OPL2]ROZ88974.1 hypothetical protein EEB19_19890 [Gordonia sp. OPL2]